MKYFFSLAVLCFFMRHTSAQEGNSFLTHYTPSDERIDYRSVGMIQDSRGLIYFTNKKGVLEFDGKNWKLIATPSAVYTLSLSNDEVYAGGAFGLGKLVTNKKNQTNFQLLFSAPHVFSTVVAEGKVFACNEKTLFIFSNDKIEAQVQADASESFSGLLEIQQHVFLKSTAAGLSYVKSNQRVKETNTLPTDSEIIFTSENKNGDVILGTERGKVYIIKGKAAPTEVALTDATYLQQNKLVNGVWVSENIIAIGTLLGGVVLSNPNTGATVDIIDYNHGLPDNEVFALLMDKNQGVWVAHQYGFTRIAPAVPFRSFNHYNGLSGNLLCAKSFMGQVYVGTTLGLFKLTKEESNQVVTTVAQTLEKNAQENTRRGLFGFLRKRTKPDPANNKPTVYTTKVAQPSTYVYKKVDGINGKITHLIDINGKLIAAGLGGVFEIQNNRTVPVVLEAVHSIFFSPSLQQLMVSTYHDQMRTFSTNNGWKETNMLDTLRDYISYAFEDNLQNIWLCGRSDVYKIETIDGAITDVSKLAVDNPSLDEMVGVAYGGEVYIATSNEFKRFNVGSQSFVKYDSLPGPHRYFASAGFFWFNDGNQWRTVDKKLQSLKLQWLGLFPNLRYLSPDEKGENLWVITAGNELYKFSGKAQLNDEHHYPLILRNVQGQEIKLNTDKKVVMDQPENVLSFEFIQPEYVSRNAVQYRYQVKGLTNGWTAWSSSNHIANFPFLPAGDYQLLMQSRDLMGSESRVETINFEVLPPYWKRWWFYALEFVFFSVLVAISVRVSVSNTKYRWVSEVLSLLTVIIFIQFVSTGINSIINLPSSPVIQFFVQVLIALLVFPLENYFRKFMRAAADGSLQKRLKIKQP